MKRILEVLQDGDGQLKFRTDINVWKDPMVSMDIIQNAMLSMSTTLWGGNEQSVLAMIRSLAIADLALSTNRDEMIEHLKDASRSLADAFNSVLQEERLRGSVTIFPPNVRARPEKADQPCSPVSKDSPNCSRDSWLRLSREQEGAVCAREICPRLSREQEGSVCARGNLGRI